MKFTPDQIIDMSKELAVKTRPDAWREITAFVNKNNKRREVKHGYLCDCMWYIRKYYEPSKRRSTSVITAPGFDQEVMKMALIVSENLSNDD